MEYENDLLAFKESWRILVRNGEITKDKLLVDNFSLQKLFSILHSTKENGKIHFMGMGRSGKVANIFSELMKDLGFHTSFIGKSLASRVEENDVLFTISGSGWTQTTCQAAEAALKNGATLITFSADHKSLLARLSDCCILIPSRKIEDIEIDSHTNTFLSRQIQGKVAPLTPMGTMFELTSLGISVGIIGGVNQIDPLEDFEKTSKILYKNAYHTLEKIEQSESIKVFIDLLIDYIQGSFFENSVFFVGSGLTSIIAAIAAIRFSHLGIKVKSAYDWRFRRRNDLLICISGSGETKLTYEYLKMAKENDMHVVSLSSWPNSTISTNADLRIEISGRKEQYSEYEKPLLQSRAFIPDFEYCCAIFLDAIVAQIALNLGITEGVMKSRHANVE